MSVDLEGQLVARATPVRHDTDIRSTIDAPDAILVHLDAVSAQAREQNLTGLALAPASDQLAAQQIRLRLANHPHQRQLDVPPVAHMLAKERER